MSIQRGTQIARKNRQDQQSDSTASKIPHGKGFERNARHGTFIEEEYLKLRNKLLMKALKPNWRGWLYQRIINANEAEINDFSG